LGQPFEITGAVVSGQQRGRDLGFPTANLRPESELLPRPGIYAGRAVVLDGDQQTASAAISVGTNPTFEPGRGITVEAHLLDFSADLYGRRIRLELRERLRDEQRFESVEALVAQMHQDVARTREVMS
jgi:riboflavin kinase/FMN adenylyltransferase